MFADNCVFTIMYIQTVGIGMSYSSACFNLLKESFKAST